MAIIREVSSYLGLIPHNAVMFNQVLLLSCLYKCYISQNSPHIYNYVMLDVTLECSYRFNQCFGVIGVLDYLHGTNNQFRSTKGYERHTLLLESTPAYIVYPDDPTIKKKNQSKTE